MSTWFQQFSLDSGDASAWLRLVPENSYRVALPNEVPRPVSPGLLAKCDSVLFIRSGSYEEEFVVANLYRRDGGKIDQMPFGTAFISGSGSAGLLTHHGDWSDRTVSGSNSPPSYAPLSGAISGVYDQAFATLTLPSKPSGSVSDLAPQSNIFAFQRVIKELRNIKKAEL
jgi:hypothetical protein